jgi:type IV pilus assembly protein PilA
MLLTLAVVYIATRLLFRRNESNVKTMRRVLGALGVASAIALVIDLGFFNDTPNLYFDGVTLISSLIWLAYFYKARRVRLVFIDGKWNYAAYAVKRVLTPEDKRRLRRRVWIASSATFVILFLLMGLALGDEKPDAGIFYLPLCYAAIAALIAWYAPLRKRGAEARVSSERERDGSEVSAPADLTSSGEVGPAQLLQSGKNGASRTLTGLAWFAVASSVIAIVAAIALPAYQDYTVRSRVIAALVALEPIKKQIVDTYQATGDLPEIDYTAIQGREGADYLKNVEMNEKGVLTVTFGISGVAATQVLVAPSREGERIVWTCHNVNTPPKYLPAPCQE